MRRYRDRRAGGRARDVPEWENHDAESRHPALSDCGAWTNWAYDNPQHSLGRAPTALAGRLPTPVLRTTVPIMRKFVNSTRLLTLLSTSATSPCPRAGLLPVMAAHTGLIFPGGHRHQDRRTYGVAQANNPIGEGGGPIETF